VDQDHVEGGVHYVKGDRAKGQTGEGGKNQGKPGLHNGRVDLWNEVLEMSKGSLRGKEKE
jgi:hypothetical protein